LPEQRFPVLLSIGVATVIDAALSRSRPRDELRGSRAIDLILEAGVESRAPLQRAPEGTGR
jgi:hypothetical protein